MLNFRKLKKDFSSSIVREGKELYDSQMVLSARILSLSSDVVRLACKVAGKFENTYECEIEIDRMESMVVDSNCDCTYKYDCQHLAAILFYLEEQLDTLVVSYSRDAKLEKKEMATLKKTFQEAKTKEVAKKDKKQQKELLEEYAGAARLLGRSPFFNAEEEVAIDQAEIAVIFSDLNTHPSELQLALRLPYRSKPLNVPDIRHFLDALRYQETLFIGSKQFFFTFESFDPASRIILKFLMDFVRYPEEGAEKGGRCACLEQEFLGTLFAEVQEITGKQSTKRVSLSEDEPVLLPMPSLYNGSLEEPLRFSFNPAKIRVELEYIEVPSPKILFNPVIVVDGQEVRVLEEACLYECAKPGMIFDGTYYRFPPHIGRKHLRNLVKLREVTIPEPLFGTFVENGLPELKRYAEVAHEEIIERFVTLPFTGELKAECDISYLNGELDATLSFLYGKIKVPATPFQLSSDQISAFVSEEGILARNLTEEEKIMNALFQDFVFDKTEGAFAAKSDKKVVEFMTEVIPQYQGKVSFNCPENLLDQFIYDETKFTLKLKETERIDEYEVDLKVDGHLSGLTIDLLWECLATKRSYIEISRKKPANKKGKAGVYKILVLDLEKLAPVVQVFDEMGINRLDNHKERRPLWSLASVDAKDFKELPIDFSMTPKLKKIQKQMLGKDPITAKQVPQTIKASLRHYQQEGVGWLERLRNMHLNGILADDMGLGKTLQAIIALTQHRLDNPESLSIIVAPTSLVYNWKEEFGKFNPEMPVLVVDGTPAQRKKMIAGVGSCGVVVTSYSLLQKDVELYKDVEFGYCVLDEAQHIKNRATRNAKSVKSLNAKHRLILTGTPIENSLDELWSLFDFLMPGLLSSYERFVEKYIRNPAQENVKNLELLKRKLSPFILRRMKKDVLGELPPVSEIVYHCNLSQPQAELYRAYAESARQELTQLVEKEGFDKVQIHVLATLTRLKQICCHPAIFAKESAEKGDSTKYDMLMELLQNLMDGKHKTVIFSQYTRMLQIMKQDLERQGIPFEYLDGSSKNRLQIVNHFNDSPDIPVFLVSLKAGGAGLNLTGADTVIHYDMWWNPAVENQATDRVHRIGQKNNVSSFKLVTLGTIEEKILELQNRKRGLVKKVISSDEEAMSKLTWNEVLELLQT